MRETFGLRTTDLQAIREALNAFPAVERALLFGSRAKGTQRVGSDVDLALSGVALDERTVRDIAWQLNEETMMPYHFDVLNYDRLDHTALRAHIDRVGVCLFERGG
ncbi:MAG: nucleotidyltransferase domain-containing protein [Catalinimonas sp.]